MLNGYGCVAQLVEQLTLNQWVWGSNPHAPTIEMNKASFMEALFISTIETRVRTREGVSRHKSSGGGFMGERCRLVNEQANDSAACECYKSNSRTPTRTWKKSDTGVSRSALADERLCHSSEAQSNPHAPTSLQACIIKKGPLCADLFLLKITL